MSFVQNYPSQMKKSVDDILSNSQDVIGSSISQAYTALTTGTPLQRSPSPSRKNLTPSGSPSHTSSPKHTKEKEKEKEQDRDKDRDKEKDKDSSGNSSSNKSNSKLSKSDTHLSPNYNIERSDDNIDSLSKSSEGSNLQLQDILGKDAPIPLEKSKSQKNISERAKKTPWYNVLYPSYKSRTEDFKKLFKEVPDDERLIVDYSCAIQKDILVHGRLYVSQNYLCFHANIIVWETRLSIRWKDVTAITKEKTARVIPNAILVCTETEKHFLTSFTSRDKTYLMLFRVWQNALMDKPMNPQELWQWVHSCYGEQLGLTSDDEDYIDPYEDKLDILGCSKLSADSVSEEQSISESQLDPMDKPTQNSAMLSERKISKEKTKNKKSIVPKGALSKLNLSNNLNNDDKMPSPTEQLPTDMSDSTDSDQDKNIDFINQAECTSMHEGRQLVHTILPINVDTLFSLLFSKSKFLTDFHNARKTTDMVHGEWKDIENGLKERIVSLTIAITQTIGPKSAQVTETQVLRDCSKPGQLYSVDVTSVNAGIPYADSFYVTMHYCLSRTTDDHTVLSVHAQIKYKKSIFGFVRGFIEKNTWVGLEDFYTSLLYALQSEYCIPPAKGKRCRPRRGAKNYKLGSIQQQKVPDEAPPSKLSHVASITRAIPVSVSPITAKLKNHSMSWFVIILLIALIIVNVILYIKLWDLEGGRDGSERENYPDYSLLKDPPKTHEEWIKLLQQQEALHAKEMLKWQKVLETAIELLRKTEHTLTNMLHLSQTQHFKTTSNSNPSKNGIHDSDERGDENYL